MSTLQRIENIIFAAIMIGCAIFMCAVPSIGYLFVVAIIGVILAVKGIKQLIYYFTMARYMVGGKMIFFLGIIMLDFGLFTCSLMVIPMGYVMAYLVLYNLVSGCIEILRAIEAKKNHGDWKLLLIAGLVFIGVAIACMVFKRSMDFAVYIYCAGMIFDGARRIVNSLRRTAVIYIQ